LLGFIGPAIPFLPLFFLLPQLIQQAMMVDTYAVIDLFGKNVQVKKVFWTLFIMMAWLMLARVVEPVTAQLGVGKIRTPRIRNIAEGV
jgi:hypothetical protein